jgi:hypothetical protein
MFNNGLKIVTRIKLFKFLFLIGFGAEMLKSIGSRARMEMEEMVTAPFSWNYALKLPKAGVMMPISCADWGLM